MLDEGAEASHQFFPWRQVFFQSIQERGQLSRSRQ